LVNISTKEEIKKEKLFMEKSLEKFEPLNHNTFELFQSSKLKFLIDLNELLIGNYLLKEINDNNMNLVDL
jgi:hypothetical protein